MWPCRLVCRSNGSPSPFSLLLPLPGFARSSRPHFSSDPKVAEEQYVIALEEWRKKQGIDKMCLLGHSFGGYLSTAYALTYPER